MKLLLESWRQYLKESVFHVKIELLLPTEELGHGKDHVCPSQECENLIQQKVNDMKKGVFKPIEVCQKKPVNTYRTKEKELASKSSVQEPFFYVLNGHHRLEAAKRLGIQELPVILTQEES